MYGSSQANESKAHSQAGGGHCTPLVSSFTKALSNAHLIKLSFVSTVSCSFWQLFYTTHLPFLAPAHLLSENNFSSYFPDKSRFSVMDSVNFTAPLPLKTAFYINTCPLPVFLWSGAMSFLSSWSRPTFPP